MLSLGSLANSCGKIYVTSSSKLKLDAVHAVYPHYNIVSVIPTIFEFPEQPINTYGIMCAKMRMDDVLKQGIVSGMYHSIISIESYIDERIDRECICLIQKYPDGRTFAMVKTCPQANIPQELYYTYTTTKSKVWGGYATTFGEYMNSENPKNWYGHRFEDIASGLEELSRVSYPVFENELIYAYLDYFKDFPKAGVVFTSLDSIFSNRVLLQSLQHHITFETRQIGGYVDHIIGLETRGIHLGVLLAHEFNCGFQIARKAGKLPYSSLLKSDYSTEYSKDAMELAPLYELKMAQTILIVDDIIATGGSIVGVTKCIRQINENAKIYCYAPIHVFALEPVANGVFLENSVINV